MMKPQASFRGGRFGWEQAGLVASLTAHRLGAPGTLGTCPLHLTPLCQHHEDLRKWQIPSQGSRKPQAFSEVLRLV